MAVGLIFSGQGAQVVGMGQTLYEQSERARQRYDEAADLLGFDIRELSFTGPEAQLTETRVCQPALYIHGFIVAELLDDAGKTPDVIALAGLSLGELTALARAEAFDFATGLKLVAERGRLMQEACERSKGGMVSLIGGDLRGAYSLAEEYDVDVANLNCPGQTVLSGDADRCAKIVDVAKSNGFKTAIPLKVAGAYHSRLMQPAADAFAQIIESVEIRAPKRPVFSNFTGQQVENPAAIKEALISQIVGTVRWDDCFRGMIALGAESFYECGPGDKLVGLAKRIDRDVPVICIEKFSDIPA